MDDQSRSPSGDIARRAFDTVAAIQKVHSLDELNLVVEDSFRPDRFHRTELTAKDHLLATGPWECPLDVAEAGLETIEWLGVGGMGTRGFGRMRIVKQVEEESNE